MPTLFGRRYMRDRVPRAEAAVGMAVLLVLAGIVAAAVTVGKRDERPLFELKPGVERGSALTREQRVAMQLMPGFGTAGWQVPEALEVLNSRDLEAAGEAELTDAGAVRLYRGAYANAASGETLPVEIVDLETPANAFGLFCARRPEHAGPLAVGNEGWQTEMRGGFWSGRYYTEFDRSRVQGDQPSARTVADALGSVQIAYGRPFEAERALPSEDRIEGSFAFVRRGAAGFVFLDDAFLAAYRTGVTAFVAESGTSSRAAELIERFESYLAERGRVQARPEAGERSILAGDFADKQLAVFHAGTRVYGAIGGEMEPVSALVQRMLGTVRPRTGGEPATEAVAQAKSPFPAIEMGGWPEPNAFREYTPLNLWEKIDGRAEIYLQFGMERMRFGTYRDKADPERSIDVYWYTMASTDRAFGIYRAEAGGHTTELEVGDEGYLAGGSVVFRKGRDYVRIEGSDGGETIQAAGGAIARAVASRIEDAGGGLWAESVLPADHRTSEALDYHGANAFSLDFLRDVFSAEYAVEGTTYTTFVHRAADEPAALALLAAYEAFFADYGKVLERGRAGGVELLVGESGGLVDAVFVRGAYLGGVNNCSDAAFARERALEFARSMSSAKGPSE